MKKLLLLPVLLLVAATYGPPFSVSDFSSLTNRPNPSAANPVGIVLGRTNAYDGGGGMFIYNPLATNTVDGENYLPATTAGRWIRVDRLLLTANSPLLYSNGALSLSELTNYFSFLAGTNMQVTVTSNAVTYAMTNTTAGGSSSTNWYAYVVNTSQLIEKFGLIGNDSSDSYGQLIWNVAATTNLLGGTNIFASIADHKITNVKLDYIPTNSLLGSDLSTTAGSFANVGTVYIGANLLLSESGGVNTLSAITSSGTNTWQIGVDGVVVTTPNLADGANISVSSSGTNVTFNLTATGVSAGTYSNVVITLDDRGRVTSASSGNLFTTLTNILTAGTNIVLTYGAGTIGINSYAAGGGGGGGDVYTSSNNVFTGTNTFTEQVIFDDLLVTNLTAENLILPFADGLVGSDSNSNAFKVTIGANLTYSSGTLSATGGGGATNGTAVTVDGGADLTRANFADSSLVTFTASGTNITASIPDDSLALGTKTTGNFVAGVSGTANEVTVTGGSGSEASTGTISLPSTIDLGGKTSFELPNSAAPTTDAFGELAGDDNAWASGRGALQFFDGTASTWLVGVLSSDTPSNGQVPTWNTGGTITWETPSAGGGGTSTNILVNGVLVQNANLTNSSTVVWSVSGTNISATVTNVAGSTTSNVVQRTGIAVFDIYDAGVNYDIRNVYTSGCITNVTMAAGREDVQGRLQISITDRGTTNFFVKSEIEASYGDGNGGPVGFVEQSTRTTSYFDFIIFGTAGSATPQARVAIWIEEPVTVGGSGSGGGGDVYSASNNVFTASNNFSGTITAPTQSLGTSNTTVSTTAFAQQLAELRQLANTILTQLSALTNGSAGQVPTWTGASTLALSNTPSADVQVFAAGTNTWTKPANKSVTYVIAFAGGGGGGSGRRGAAGSIRSGGAGGASGAMSDNWFLTSALASTETVIVGAGGAGATAQTSDNSNGSTGTIGGNTTFGSWVWAGGGAGGGGGDSDGVSGPGGGSGKIPGITGGSSSATGAAGSLGAQAVTTVTGSGGGGGGGITSADAASNGGAGGEGPRMWRGASQIAGGTAGSAGGNGGAGNTAGSDVRIGGSGGGGGASSISAAAGAGGNGGLYGAGGGGGGASLNGNNSGAGGSGADGVVVVISY